MLFNSYIFIFVFFPITLIGFYLIGGRTKKTAIAWLFFASLVFYGWWHPVYLVIIIGSILFNYFVGRFITTSESIPPGYILAFGITCNLLLIGYYKYAVFFVSNITYFTNYDFQLEPIILPLGISFFTFQQIAYLVDAHDKTVKKHDLLHYCAFVAFFPQLIAGPIINQKELLPQLVGKISARINYGDFAVGLTVFSLGLAKKTLIADNIAVYVTPGFTAVSSINLAFFEAWFIALAYTLQLYFDFSGYSDMAIGLARFFGIRIPINFNSPYKAVSIIDFWRRWHITLSRFLREYLYIPLGGNRRGSVRRYVNITITMLLGGLWHGAGWTFVIWGGLHGLYILINHFWRSITHFETKSRNNPKILALILSRMLTFVAVVIAWVFFRSENLSDAINFLSSMFGINGISLPSAFKDYFQGLTTSSSLAILEFGVGGAFPNRILAWRNGLPSIAFLLAVVWFFPNVQQFMGMDGSGKLDFQKGLPGRLRKIRWQPRFVFILLNILVLAISIMAIQGESEFLYFQF